MKHLIKLSLIVVALVSTQAFAESLLRKTVEISDIDALEVKGPGKLTITQGDTESLEIIASEKLMKLITVDAEGTSLRLRIEDNQSWNLFNFDKDVTYKLQVINLHRISTTGSVDVFLDTDLKAPNLKIKRAGSGDMKYQNIHAGSIEISSAGSGDMRVKGIKAKEFELNSAGSGDYRFDNINVEHRVEVDIAGSGDVLVEQLNATNLEIEIAGSGDASIGAGEVVDQAINISGSGDYSAAKVRSSNATVDLAGSANALIWVTDSLVVDASGSSDVGYYGKPSVKLDTSGASSVKSRGLEP